MKKRFIFIGVLIITLMGFVLINLIDGKPKAILILKELNSSYWELIEAGAESGFHDFGIDGKVIAPASGTLEGQIDLLQEVLEEKPDILIISPIAPDHIIPHLEVFVKQGIPVILLDTDDPWENKITYVGTDNITLGKMAGALLASQLQPGNEVAIIGIDNLSPVASKRINGAKTSLELAAINVVAETIDVSYKLWQVQNAVVKLINENPEIKGIIATNDGLALAAYEVIKELGINIPIIGADGINEMIELIEDGFLTGTVAQNPFDMGYLSVETASRLAMGESVERNIDSGVDIIVKGNAEQRLNFQNRLLRQ
ncbi:hypothetical protein BKP45_07255 [Anaerobacillus alkalidiazotrophicus]|uniref:Periplasmic binding protein domain-containing protein n=1 Tax=Anaerobacillus alkalidiazotrophicus TaxID=472963 RepID=A0A1S2MCX6_9BACI|nr:substrate-binding domain-containing protein [Anaerobacillus alkalidiazotrophicus]OIJ22424.1 hypothetical protein BKP45_07255 [Anaerobacillus alkalidiazotrophicus]